MMDTIVQGFVVGGTIGLVVGLLGAICDVPLYFTAPVSVVISVMAALILF